MFSQEIIFLTIPNHINNVYVAIRIEASWLDYKIVAIAKHESEVKDLTNMGIPSFYLYREAGKGLTREALNVTN